MFAWICPKCGKEIPPQYDGCPEWCPEFDKQKAYLKNTERPMAEATSPVLKNLVQVEGKQGSGIYSPSSKAPPVPEPDETTTGPRIRPAAAAVAYEEGVPEYVPGSGAVRHDASVPGSSANGGSATGSREMNPLLVTLLATIVFLALGFAGYKYYERSKGPADGVEVSAGAVSPGGSALNRALSVAGLRFVPGKDRKLEARFLIVNNTGAQTPKFSGMVYVRPKDATADETPILTFALTGVELGPYESREMQAPLQTALRSYELPDGNLVRTDLVITEPVE